MCKEINGKKDCAAKADQGRDGEIARTDCTKFAPLGEHKKVAKKTRQSQKQDRYGLCHVLPNTGIKPTREAGSA